MKYSFQQKKLLDLADVKGGKRLPKDSNLIEVQNSHPYIRVRDLTGKRKLELDSSYLYVDDETQKKIAKYIVNTGDIVISVVGTIGLISIVGSTLNNANLTENCDKIINLKQDVDKGYLYYYLKSDFGKAEIKKGTVGAVQPKLPIKNIENFDILFPDIYIQKKIARLLSIIDDKIELNNKINDNLHSQLISYYKEIFCNDINRRVCRAEEYFDITIGKTPPRKEQQWFSENPKNIKWFSIADMGKAGVFIDESSEHLTEEAIEKYNVVIVPENTLILSFKLTVGRIAITTNKCTTNEAIAHFKTNNKDINPYLYCYLKTFKYGELGSTSSIATAINSKIVKSMPFIIPNDDELLKFNLLALPIMSRIRINENENYRLSELRDTLLPKLMSGEIDVSNIKLDL